MKLTASQERELLRIYRAQPDLPPTETIGQRGDRRGLEKAGALLWIGDDTAFRSVAGQPGPWELTAAGLKVARELDDRAETEGATRISAESLGKVWEGDDDA